MEIVSPSGLQGLLLPDLQTHPPEDLLLLASQNGGWKILRFSNSISNLGDGVAELVGKYNRQTDTVKISQNIFKVDGTTVTREVGEFVFHLEHDHWHWEDFALYEVWSVTLDGSLDRLVSSSGKVGYCLRDDNPLPANATGLASLRGKEIAARGVYLGCSWQRQGISVGWMDTYSRNTPGQFVDISGTPDGLYALRSTVDPDDLLLELDETNNTAVLFFTLRENRLQVIGASITPLPTATHHQVCHLMNILDFQQCRH